MSISLVLFYTLSVIAVLAAIAVVSVQNIVRAALFLVASMIMVAGIFILLYADFLALVQVLIYGGAVTILLLFGLMLTRIGGGREWLDNPQKPVAVIAGVLFFVVFVFAIWHTPWAVDSSRSLQAINIKDIGQSLFGTWAAPFEIASLVLLVALIGAIVLARREDME